MKVKQMVSAMEFLITNCVTLWGEEVLTLLTDSTHAPAPRPDSGTDSDSMHSVLSMSMHDTRREFEFYF
jgi:hypothetical protein